MKNITDVKIEYFVTNGRNYPEYNFKVYTDITDFGKISGHRFVSLVDYDSPYENDLSMLLQFIGRSPFIENDYMKVGSALELSIIKASERQFGISNVKHGFGFEDLKNGTDDFHFIRDLMFEENGQSMIGEVKTFYNKNKIGLSDDNPLPKPHISWWLQTRLEVEILNKPARIFYYYVTPTTKNAVLKGRPITIKPKYLFMSDVIEPTEEKEEVIESYFSELGFTRFSELMEYALYRQEDLMDNYYEDQKGCFYYVKVPIKAPWYGSKNHVEQFLEDISTQIKVEEIEHENK